MIRRTARLLFLAWLLACGAQAGMPVPPLEEGYPADYLLGDSANIIWLNSRTEEVRDFTEGKQLRWHYHYRHWNTATGRWRDLPTPDDLDAKLAVEIGADVVMVGTRWAGLPGKAPASRSVAWSLSDGGFIEGQFTVPSPDKLVALADGSVLLVGGRTEDGKTRTNAVERVRRDGKELRVDRLPDIPGPIRHSYAVVALADGRALVLGGTEWSYTGCGGCLAETYLLDPRGKTWSAGPRMREARADATATRLPDGSILVAGGWAPGHDWNEEASRTTERWRPGEAEFVAGPPLPVPVATHRVKWLAGSEGRELLLASGYALAWKDNDSVLVFDVARDEWRTAGEHCRADGKGGFPGFGSFLHEGAPWFWCDFWDGMKKGKFAQLRLPSKVVPVLAGEEGKSLRRGGAAFATGEEGLLAAGGSVVDAATSSAVDLFSGAPAQQSLAPLNRLRIGAQAFALPIGGFLVVGGVAGGWHDGRSARANDLPAEWLAGGAAIGSARWQEIQHWRWAGACYGQSIDGNLIALSNDGRSMDRVALATGPDNRLSVQVTALPALARQLSQPDNGGDASNIVVRGLQDGRIVVAGGKMCPSSVAVLDVAAADASALDRYVELGVPETARRYQLFDPATRTWRVSAPAQGTGGAAAILDSGQVVMVTPSKIVGEQKADGTWPRSDGLLEISDADGGAWQQLSPPPLVPLDEHARPFVIQGELLLTGVGEVNTGGGASLLQWFDTAAKHWVTLWQAPANSNWRDHQGRVVVRKLGNGKLLAIPVEGL